MATVCLQSKPFWSGGPSKYGWRNFKRNGRARHPSNVLSHGIYRSSVEENAEKTGASLKALAARHEFARLQVEHEVRTGKTICGAHHCRKGLAGESDSSRWRVPNGRPLLGSTSERVRRKALVPVMITKKPLSSEAKTFLVPTDFSSCAKRAAEEAINLAMRFGGRVVFFHVLYPSYRIVNAHELGASPPIPPPSPEEIEPEWKAFLSGLSLEKIEW